jgi:hypothetical protein
VRVRAVYRFQVANNELVLLDKVLKQRQDHSNVHLRLLRSLSEVPVTTTAMAGPRRDNFLNHIPRRRSALPGLDR